MSTHALGTDGSYREHGREIFDEEAQTTSKPSKEGKKVWNEWISD